MRLNKPAYLTDLITKRHLIKLSLTSALVSVIIALMSFMFVFVSLIKMLMTGNMLSPQFTFYCGWYIFITINILVLWSLISRTERHKLRMKLQVQHKNTLRYIISSLVLSLLVIMACSTTPMEHALINVYVSILFFIITLQCETPSLSIISFWIIPLYVLGVQLQWT